MKGRTLPPYLVFFAAVLALAPLHLIIPIGRVIPVPVNLIGVLCVGAGVALSFWERAAMDTYHQSGGHVDVPTRLITDGPFRFTRNPLYLGMVWITLGLAILVGSVIALVVVAVEIALMDRWGIPTEERALAGAFGADFENYRRRVRRWL